MPSPPKIWLFLKNFKAFLNVSILSLRLIKISLRKLHVPLRYLGKQLGGGILTSVGLLRVTSFSSRERWILSWVGSRWKQHRSLRTKALRRGLETRMECQCRVSVRTERTLEIYWWGKIESCQAGLKPDTLRSIAHDHNSHCAFTTTWM